MRVRIETERSESSEGRESCEEVKRREDEVGLVVGYRKRFVPKTFLRSWLRDG